MKYGKQFGVSISKNEAKKIAAFLRGRNVDIFNPSARGRLLKEIEKLTSPTTAKAVSQVVTQFTK
jgi:5,10-methylene-tetrahydrofolate dehydrogenase/methenyl tetrahydrofolate cyclohydrolase